MMMWPRNLWGWSQKLDQQRKADEDIWRTRGKTKGWKIFSNFYCRWTCGLFLGPVMCLSCCWLFGSGLPFLLHHCYVLTLFFLFLFVCLFFDQQSLCLFLKHTYYLLFSKQPHKCWLTQASHSTAVSQVSDHLLSYLTLFVAPLSSAGAAWWACHSLKGTDDARSCWRAKQISALPWCRDCAITPPHPQTVAKCFMPYTLQTVNVWSKIGF